MNSKDLFQSSKIRGKKKNLKAIVYLASIPIYLYHSLAIKDYWVILFISCFALYSPLLWFVCVAFLCYKTYVRFQHSHIVEIENAQSIVVQSLQLNQLQCLSEAIESNPEILYCDYQRRSLIAWCRYYKNTRAQELIIQLMKKYPKEAIAA